VEELSNNSSEA